MSFKKTGVLEYSSFKNQSLNSFKTGLLFQHSSFKKNCIIALFMASGSEDEIQGAWYFGSSQYDPQSSSKSELEQAKMAEQQVEQQDNHHKPRLNSEMRHLIFQKMLSLRTSDSLLHGTFKRIAQ